MSGRNGKSALLPAPMQAGRNGGRLRTGNPGNKGGGRPPSVIREKLRGSFENRIKQLEAIADGRVKEASVADRIRAMDILAKYGLGTTITPTDGAGNDLPARFTLSIGAPVNGDGDAS